MIIGKAEATLSSCRGVFRPRIYDCLFGVRVSDVWLRVCPAMHRQGSDLWGWAAVVPSCRQASVRQKDVPSSDAQGSRV